MRVGVWLVMGVFVYIFYGRTHSSLTDVVYVPVAQAEEIYGSYLHQDLWPREGAEYQSLE